MQPNILAELKKSLVNEHDRLVTELKGIAVQTLGGKDGWSVAFPEFENAALGSHTDPDEEADEVEEYEARIAAENSLATRLLQVNRALERIALGAYGACTACKKPIPLDRLRANPAAEYDMACSAPEITRELSA